MYKWTKHASTGLISEINKTANKSTGKPIGTWDKKYYIEVSKLFKQKAKKLNINIRWGGDWKSFKDCSNFELI